jgi:hypothetical protein
MQQPGAARGGALAGLMMVFEYVESNLNVDSYCDGFTV